MIIREYSPNDCNEIICLFYNTVHSVNIKDYSKEQVSVWAPDNIDPAVWDSSLSEHYTVVSEIDGRIAGFGDISGSYLDRLYVHKDYQRIGIASAIVKRLEQNALLNDCRRITTYASITAKPFFKNRGYKEISEHKVKRNDVILTNFLMEKIL